MAKIGKKLMEATSTLVLLEVMEASISGVEIQKDNLAI
jgi:hypothetical protein